jgi:hypothetical protein
VNDQIDAEAVINDLLDQLRQANLSIAILRSMLNKPQTQQDADGE